MRRSSTSFVVLLILALVAALRFYPAAKRWLPAARRTVVPVAAPGAAPVEGPYFSDGDRVADRMISAINRTQKSLHVAIYDLTHADIVAALEVAHHRAVDIRIVADDRQSREPHSEISYLRSRGLAVRLSRGYKGNRSIMHNKFAVFDGKLAVTGSFNWTTSADNYNFENALFISDPTIVARFEDEFERIWSQPQ